MACEVEGELVAGDLAGGDGAAYVEGVGRPQRQEFLRALRDGGVEVEGVGEVELAGDLAGAAEGDLLVVDGEVPASADLLRRPRRPSSGMNRAIASAISRSSAAMPIRCANGATWASTNAAASSDNEGGLRDPAGAPGLQVTGLHPGPVRGRRYFSSTAAATSARPPSVERPIARANSAMQNSATNGAPSPASVRPVSPPGVIQVAASSMDSGGCCSAQVTAAVSRSACRAVGCGLAFAGEHQHLTRGVEVSAVGVGGCCHE